MDSKIYSIGYGTRSIEDVLGQLAQARIDYVIDVRSSPFSKFKPEFSRTSLDAALASHGIKYVFMGDSLGGRPKDDDCYTEGKADYAKIKDKDFFKTGIKRLVKAYEKGFKICLLCSENLPSHCHRSKLISVELADIGLKVTHILPNGEYQSQDDVVLSLIGAQADLFGERFTSRKAYR